MKPGRGGGPQNPSIVAEIQFIEGFPYENGVEPFSEFRPAIEPEGLPYENGVKPFTEVRCRQRLKGSMRAIVKDGLRPI